MLVMPVELEPSQQIEIEALVHPALPESVVPASEPTKAVRVPPAASVVSGQVVVAVLELVGGHPLPTAHQLCYPELGHPRLHGPSM